MNTRVSSGFSLIELMTAIVIMSILVMLALPSYSRWISNTQVRNMAESVQNGLRAAQREAAARNGSVTFLLTNASPPICTSTAASSGANWAICAGSLVIQQSVGKTGNGSAVVASDFSSVGFDGLGRTNLGGPAVVSVTSTQGDCEQASTEGIRCLNVLLSPGGKVRLCDPRLSASVPSEASSACN